MTDTSSYETILVGFADGVATITLNRPEKLNAFNGRMTAELSHAFAALDDDDDTRAIVVTGAGRAFSSGADLSGAGEDTFGGGNREMRRREAEGVAQAERPRRPWEMSTPVIGAINGAAVGMGLTLPCQWDIRVVAEDAKLGFVFNRRGVIPEANSLWIVPRLVGLSRAFELLGTGRYFTGREAAEIGLASQALPADQVLPAAQAIGREFTLAAPTSVAITKRLLYAQLMQTDRAEAQALESRLFAWAGRQPDSKEGVGAFLQKRDPKWTMSKTRDLPEELR
jgi:enoyl-CoA hydratase/carnithine racemase